MEYRRLHVWEELPPTLRVPALEVDTDWTWVAVKDGAIVAAMFCGGYQGLLFIGTLQALPEAGVHWVRPLLRQAALDCWERGVRAYMTFLDGGEVCAKLRTVMGEAIVHEEAFTGKIVTGRGDRFI